MNRPGRGCLTCKLAECTGCDSILCTPEESAMTRCTGLPRKNARTKKAPRPVAASLSTIGKKIFRAYCSTPTGGNAI